MRILINVHKEKSIHVVKFAKWKTAIKLAETDSRSTTAYYGLVYHFRNKNISRTFPFYFYNPIPLYIMIPCPQTLDLVSLNTINNWIYDLAYYCSTFLIDIFVKSTFTFNFRTPEQCPSVVSLLSESYNPHVRYGAAIALGISCAGTGLKVSRKLREWKW